MTTARPSRFAAGPASPPAPRSWPTDPRGRRVADVVGWRERPGGDVDVWIVLHADQQDLRTAAVWDELAGSPRLNSRGDEWARSHAVVAEGRIRELSLVRAGENRLPNCSVILEACPAAARPGPPAPHPNPGNYSYRDQTGRTIHVRSWGKKLSVR